MEIEYVVDTDADCVLDSDEVTVAEIVGEAVAVLGLTDTVSVTGSERVVVRGSERVTVTGSEREALIVEQVQAG